MIVEIDEIGGEEEATIRRRIVAFLLAYFESHGLVIDEVEEPGRECENADAVPPSCLSPS